MYATLVLIALEVGAKQLNLPHEDSSVQALRPWPG